jgi:hypothetical protein
MLLTLRDAKTAMKQVVTNHFISNMKSENSEFK